MKHYYYMLIWVAIALIQTDLNGAPATESARTNSTAQAPASFNGDFEKWQTMSNAPAGWNLANNLFPENWMNEGRPEERGFVRMVTNSAQEEEQYGKHSLFLNGRILSGHAFSGLSHKSVLISLMARGENGTFTVRLREYTSKGGVIDAMAEVMKRETTAFWQEYSVVVSMTPWHGASFAMLDMEADGVVIDNIKFTVIEPMQESREEYEAFFTIPESASGIKVDGVFSEDKWKNAINIKNGFMNINTRSAIMRQTDLYVSADEKMLYICTQTPVRPGGLKTTVDKRDGNIWEDESVEIFINPSFGEKAPPAVYQLVINAKGIVFDQLRNISIGQDHIGWDCAGLLVGTKSVADKKLIHGKWVLEVGIPLSEVGLAVGKKFGLNICRNLHYPGEYTSLTGLGYHDYKNMMACVISENAPAISWGYGGQLKEGKISLEAAVRNTMSQPQTYTVSALLEGKEKKEETQVFKLAADETRKIVVNDIMKSGLARVEAADEKGQKIFSQSVRIDTDSFISQTSDSSALPVKIEFYPIQGKLNVRLVNLKARKDTEFGRTDIFVYQGKKLVLEKSVEKPLIVADAGHVTVPFSPKENGEYVVKAVLHDANGNCVDFVSGKIEKKDTPWLGNSLGKDRIVIPPFTPLEVKKNTVGCVGRTYKFAGSALPERINADGKEILAEPVRLILEDENGEKEGKNGTIKFSEKSADRVGFSGSVNFEKINARFAALMEYDGMLKYEMTLEPRGETAIQKLALLIPINGLKYFHTGGNHCNPAIWMMEKPVDDYADPSFSEWTKDVNQQKSGGSYASYYFLKGDGIIWSSAKLASTEIYGNFLPYAWMGNHKYGLGWSANNDRGWTHDVESACMELIRKGATVFLKINFIAKPVTLKEARKITFGLIATPVRPRRTGANIAFRTSDMGFGNPFTLTTHGVECKDFYLAARAFEADVKQGTSKHLYTANQEVSPGDPAVKYMKDEWSQEPFSMYTLGQSALPYKLYGSDIDNYNAIRHCSLAGIADYKIWRINEWLEKTGMAGYYLDNSYPNACVNIQHPECGYVREDGRLQGGFHIFETRDFIKRSVVLSCLHKTKAPHFCVHMSSHMNPLCFGFADLYIDGENDYKGKDFMDYWSLARLEVIGASAWGANMGWLPMIHSYLGKDCYTDVKATRTMLAALKLYDMWIWDAYSNVETRKKFEKIETDFGIADPGCVFVGYWEDTAKPILSLPKGVKASYYVKKGQKVLVYLGNFTKDKQEVELKLNLAGYDMSAFKITDTEDGKEVQGKLAVEGKDLRCILVNKN